MPEGQAIGRNPPAADPDDPIEPVVVFLLDGQRYGLELSSVERVLPMAAITPLAGAPAVALGVLNVQGEPLPACDLRRRLGLPEREYGWRARLLLVRTRRRRLLLPVDEAVGVVDVPAASVASATTLLPGLRHIARIAALPDGLLYLHDLDQFLSLDEEQQLDQALADLAP